MRAKFAELKYAGGAAACHAEAKEPWLTAEQIPVKDNYTAAAIILAKWHGTGRTPAA